MAPGLTVVSKDYAETWSYHSLLLKNTALLACASGGFFIALIIKFIAWMCFEYYIQNG